MITALQIINWLSGLVVLAEALNKLERTCPVAPGMTRHQRLVDSLKALAWALLAIGAAGSVASPVLMQLGMQQPFSGELMRLEHPTLADTCVLLGFAVLIVRTRVKEG